MSTTVKTHQGDFSSTAEKVTATAAPLSEFWKMVEFNRYGITPLLLILMVCMSGIAAGFGAPGDALQIGIVAFPCCIALALILAVAPMKAIIYTSVVALVLDLFVLIF